MTQKKTSARKEPIPKELYDVLACPMCKSDVRYNEAKTALICVKCGNRYPIKEGIPVMLPPVCSSVNS